MSAQAEQIERDVNPDVEALRKRALESVTLAIELFNRPVSTARAEAVLILLHHAFELLLKSIIVDRKGTVFDEERGYSYAFDTCLNFAEQRLKIINADERRFLSMLDNLRDSAVHYYQDVPESVLYVFAQGSVSLLSRLLRATTGKGLLVYLPNRVLPICSIPPLNLSAIIDDEFDKLQQLVQVSGISKQQAVAALRPLMAFKIAGEPQHRRMTAAELDVAIDALRGAQNWRSVFPEIARVEFSSEGDPIPVSFRVTKSDPNAIPVAVVKPGDPTEPTGTIIEREINVLDKFNLGLQQLAQNLGASMPRTLAMVREHLIQEDSASYREVAIGKTRLKRYSKKALDTLRTKLETVEECWAKHRGQLAGHRRRRT